MITPERLREVLQYDAETGEFTWKVSCRNSCKPGRVAGRLGLFATPEEAYAKYCDAAERLHGAFANLGVISSAPSTEKGRG